VAAASSSSATGGGTEEENKMKRPETNPYDVLKLDITASKRAARQAFRALAKAAHPDSGGSAVGQSLTVVSTDPRLRLLPRA